MVHLYFSQSVLTAWIVAGARSDGRLCASSNKITLFAMLCSFLQSVGLSANKLSKNRTDVVIITDALHLADSSRFSSVSFFWLWSTSISGNILLYSFSVCSASVKNGSTTIMRRIVFAIQWRNAKCIIASVLPTPVGAVNEKSPGLLLPICPQSAYTLSRIRFNSLSAVDFSCICLR